MRSEITKVWTSSRALSTLLASVRTLTDWIGSNVMRSRYFTGCAPSGRRADRGVPVRGRGGPWGGCSSAAGGGAARSGGRGESREGSRRPLPCDERDPPGRGRELAHRATARGGQGGNRHDARRIATSAFSR